MVKNLRGFPDIITKGPLLNRMIEICNKYARNFGYQSVFTPILESTSLFTLLGEGSDIVRKEMFTFNYKEESITLRPEITASLAKSMINNNINKGRFCYYGPNFRKERPQKGRYRQFYQFGCENIGYHSPFREIECLIIISKILDELLIEYEIIINHIGNEESRSKYINTLKQYFSTNINKLSDDSKKRLEENRILRILDSKIDQEIVKNAPSILDFLAKDEIEQLYFLCDFLQENSIKHHIENKLVRGLDYYNAIVFEVIALSSDASQNAIGGGGTYDNLFHNMGSHKRKAFGFALGLDRMLLHTSHTINEVNATLCLLTHNYKSIDIISNQVSINGIEDNLRESLIYANKNNSNYLIIIDNSYPDILIKDLKEKAQYQIPVQSISEFLRGKR